jgi:hypothetical protein
VRIFYRLLINFITVFYEFSAFFCYAIVLRDDALTVSLLLEGKKIISVLKIHALPPGYRGINHQQGQACEEPE